MRPLFYISYGMVKSGSTLAFKFAELTLEKSGFSQAKLPEAAIEPHRQVNYIASSAENPWPAVIKAVEARGTPVAIKLHRGPDEHVAALLKSGRAIGHAVYRDPREMALSMLDHGRRSRNHGRPGFAKFEELDQAVAEVDRQLPNLEAWLKLPRMEPWFYDDFAWDHPAAVARILKQCRLSGDPAAILADFDPTKGTRFAKGKPNRWRRHMNVEQAERVRGHFDRMFRRLIERRRRKPLWTPALWPWERLA